MIYVGLQGGLGNQLFQFATGRALAVTLNTGLTLDLSAFGTTGNATPRTYALDPYRLAPDVATTRSLFRRPPFGLRLSRRVEPIVYQERTYGYDPSVHDLGDGTYLAGYWQHEEYFRGERDTIVADLKLRTPLTKERAEILRRLRDSGAVAVHIRRGDYVTNARSHAFHGTCSRSYYREAMDYLDGVLDRPNYWIFTDDVDWTRASYDIPRVTVVTPTGDGRYAQDLFLFSQCRAHIIANSSFSWWGAWLSLSSGPTVAPTPWFDAPEMVGQSPATLSWVLMPKGEAP